MTTILLNSQKFITQIAQSISDLTQMMGDNFINAAQLIFESRGRLIISGVGKSGLIGRKIAATFSSLGTPAHFIHPTEAAHGDMGALARGDVLLALSKSGESVELGFILNYAKSMGIPIIAISAQSQSKLAKIADVLLPLSAGAEAGTLQVAPTTSTTQTLVWGDALALAVMELKGFSRENFHQFHPAGALGLQLLQVHKIMAIGDDIPLVFQHEKLLDALHKMDGKKFGAIGVVNAENDLIGMITDGDIRRHLGRDFLDLSIDEVMTRDPLVCTAHTLAAEVAQRMNQKNINSMFVVERADRDGDRDGDRAGENQSICQLSQIANKNVKIVGIIHIHHIFRAGII